MAHHLKVAGSSPSAKREAETPLLIRRKRERERSKQLLLLKRKKDTLFQKDRRTYR